MILAGAALALLPGAAPLPTGEVTVSVMGLRNSQGVVRACMTDVAENFPKCRDPAHSLRAVAKAAGTLTLTFRNVRPGRYAIALLHDENDNGKMDRTLMIPHEGFGFSRDAKATMRPPEFDQAAFQVAGGKNESLRIHMRYMS